METSTEPPYAELGTSPISEEREEGEIIDDDFEDISDNSISVSFSGKSICARPHLPAICLSSVSEDDQFTFYEKPIRKRKKSYKKRKHRKRVVPKSDSDEEYIGVDRDLQEQLKAAVRIDHSDNEEQKNNSLRTKLKLMSKKESSPQKQSNSNSEELDTELYALRSEALKTAVINKFKFRKRKLKNCDGNSSDSSVRIATPDGDVQPICIIDDEEPPKKVPCVEMEQQDDEDEDVLRALLLASMSKRITKNTESKKEEHVEVENLVPKIQTETKQVTNRIVTSKILQSHPLQLSKVKPVIIHLNSDSDSEEDCLITQNNIESKATTTNKNVVDIDKAVDAFLKSQRAKVEAENKPVLRLQQNNENKLEKSCVKLLPKVKQLEYKKLIKRLEDAKKLTMRKTTIKTTKTEMVKVNLKSNNKNRVLINKQSETDKKQPVKDMKEDLRLLHKTLKEMQMNENGKLQMQKKYLSLMPSIKRINEISAEKRKHDEQIKRILQELAEAKKKAMTSHQTFSLYVKELIAKKAKIDACIKLQKVGDKGIQDLNNLENLKKGNNLLSNNQEKLETNDSFQDINLEIKKKTNNLVTSTPLKTSVSEERTFNNENTQIPNRLGSDENLNNVVNSAPLRTDLSNGILDETVVITSSNSTTNRKDVDELDGDQVVLRKDTAENVGKCKESESVSAKITDEQNYSVPKYISPLDTVNSRTVDDPFKIMCPYEIYGNCCDPECIYKHYCTNK